MPHDNALVIETVIHNFKVRKVLVDNGSKVNLLPYYVFQQKRIPEEQLMRDQAPIKGIGGAIYQHLMNKIFKNEIGRSAEVYIDDMMVKSRTFQQHLVDLEEVFLVLQQYRMRLNPTKCAFFIIGEIFLGYMVSEKDIKPNPEKVKAILNMSKPICMSDVQRLTGRVVVLNRLISRSTERCLPFFKKLREVPNFEWPEDCRKAFKSLKEYLSSPHVLSSLLIGEKLLIYLAALEQAVSVMLVKEEEGTQKSIFYVNKVIKGAKVKYMNIEKLAFALLLALRKFKMYLEDHQGSRTGILLKGLDGFKVGYTLHFDFLVSNNMVEYEALLSGIQIALKVEAIDLGINNNSQLIVNQVKMVYQAKDPQIDILTLKKPTSIMQIDEERSWMTPYLEYLKARKLLEDKAKSRRIAAKVANYQAVRGTLYRRGKFSRWLRCVGPKEASRIVKEIHQGIYRVHEGKTTQINKIFQNGYY
ncbi:uncharacterized protein LOC110627616 [Manihot esculenta]|uniref:uncharacterized protein LOC110627616 n=1 Tax=Manihot esculenta TaxID=3983 RepID=UPI000B5D8187|nr:uncharacterized protein LOC110627616 [Manihot esculenta]